MATALFQYLLIFSIILQICVGFDFNSLKKKAKNLETPDPDPTTGSYFVTLVAVPKLILLPIIFYLQILYTDSVGILLYIT